LQKLASSASPGSEPFLVSALGFRLSAFGSLSAFRPRIFAFEKRPFEVLHNDWPVVTRHPALGHIQERELHATTTILIPEQVEDWLRPKLPNVIDRSRMTREERPALPFELIREAIINALVHRDYDLTGATCHLMVTADTITVRSPGAPLIPVTIEQMQAFTAPMYNRNPKLQFAFGGTKLVEGRGFGMRTLGAAAAKHGLPVPKYAFDGLYLNLTIYRHARAALRALEAAVLEKLSKSERSGWEWLASKGGAKSSDYAAAMEVDNRTARRHLNQFHKLGLVRKTGVGPSTEYHIKG
jgi:ATP-dependent DNA helicase RecG